MTHQEEMYVARAALAGVQFEEYQTTVGKHWRWKIPGEEWRRYGMYTLPRAAVKALLELGPSYIKTKEGNRYLGQDYDRVEADPHKPFEELCND